MTPTAQPGCTSPSNRANTASVLGLRCCMCRGSSAATLELSADERADGGSEGHGEGAPENDAYRGMTDVGATRPGADGAKSGESSERRDRNHQHDIPAGDSSTTSSGIAAPDAKVAAEVSAACIGRATVISEMPSSSRACAPSASLAIS